MEERQTSSREPEPDPQRGIDGLHLIIISMLVVTEGLKGGFCIQTKDRSFGESDVILNEISVHLCALSQLLALVLWQ